MRQPRRTAMQSSCLNLDIGDITAYDHLLNYSCREVLTSGLDNKVYEENFADLLSFDTVDLAIQQAYGKIMRLLHHVSYLRRTRNSLLSLCRLPSELLLRIFRLCVPPLEIQSPHGFSFSKVCAHWRHLALSDPSLWTGLNLSADTNMAKLMAERSKSMPVSIFSLSTDDLFLPFLPGRARIRSLKLYQSSLLSRDAAETGVNRFLSGQLPLIDTLDLANEGAVPEVYTCDLGDLEVPRLRVLSLVNWALRDWSLPIMLNLTCLSLKYFTCGPRDDNNEALLPLPRVLDLFRASPRLVSLRTTWLVDTRPRTNVDKTILKEVKLPHLKTLDLQEHVTVICHLLQYLHIPAADDIAIRCGSGIRDPIDIDPIDIDSFKALPGLVASILRTAHWMPLLDPQLKIDHDLRVVARKGGQSDMSTSGPCILMINIRGANMGYDLLASFGSSLASSLFSERSTLDATVGCGGHWGTLNERMPAIWATLSTLSALRTVEFTGCMCDSFVGLLLALDRSLAVGEFTDDIARPDIPFPSLRVLKIQRLRMVHMLQGKSLLAHLVALLHRRGQQTDNYHWPLSIALNDCVLNRADVDIPEIADLHIQFANPTYDSDYAFTIPEPESPAL